MAWRRPFDPRKPHVHLANICSGNELRELEPWRPYPKVDPTTLFASKSLNLTSFSLYEIGKDICLVLLSGSPDDSPLPGHTILEPSERLSRAQNIEHALIQWYENLPQTSRTEDSKDSYIAGPVLDVHLTYNVWRITLYGVLIQCKTDSPQPDREEYNQKTISACASIAGLVQAGQRSWGLSNGPFSMVHGASVGTHALLGFLDRPDVPQIVHTMIVALTASCHRWTLARGIVRTLWLTLREREIESLLPDSTLDLLRSSAVEKWGPEDHRLFASCAYPNYAASDNSRYPVGIGEVLESYAQLDLGQMDQPESSSRGPG
ncbi:hypothetical protein LTS08_005263 [Lithohypha guttulata]|uniref:uncharacterized protein n=1 Tax=Lithohypha guttulata TaxID=1690604 RepID=UPI002DDE1771|nr:hypothetical protein LTR51_004896 [Lithohypha guttulata]KAK5100512.1 hypothetical protein LTS08_005263 [Lithohypha guttulata]